ncbi:MAG: hypothetical protein PHT37_07370 [Candidatus Cloacimonetes bacterium]|nr:hypothetical protein [Candidatus Cloacimonadota bacterium]MDD3563064.1 hypothetical protein [Candidatus Cloacimonadota bacterium]MDD4277689.1 hypothetical protein [Candidatus Cloacimonadota bacterium]MDY0326350.1 hypothetical protein [Candidatus Cloacimonadaceae bacterium]
MIKKVLLLAGIILGACLIYVYGLPALSSKPKYVEEPDISAAIKDFANGHMQGKAFEIPRNAEKWLVEQVLIHKLEELPGPHGRKMIQATVQGSFWIDQGEYSPPKQKSFKSKLQFNVGNKYPEGISVQYIR